MTFLAKLGKFLAQGISMAAGIWPLVSPIFGSNAKVQATGTTVINDLTTIGQVVVQAEALIQGAGTGPQKLAAATPLIVNIVKTSELVSGHQIANESLFIQGCTDLTNAVAEILNSLSSNNINPNGQPLGTIPPPSVAPIPASLASGAWKPATTAVTK
jgi:hypothetical protein